MMFQKGGNAVDAAAAMLAATATMWDVLHWGGETQALIYHPGEKKVIALNALGVAPTGATPEFFKAKGMKYPPRFGPLAAVTPGTPGGLMTMLAEWGTLSLGEVLAPAIQMAEGYPIEAQTANSMEREKARIKEWTYSPAVYLTHPGEAREAPNAGEIFRQADLKATLEKLVEAEAQAVRAGKSRKDAIYAAYDLAAAADLGTGTAAMGYEIDRDPDNTWLHPQFDAVVWELSPTSLNARAGLGQVIPSIDASQARHWVHPAFVEHYPVGGPPNTHALAVLPIEVDKRFHAQQAAFTVHPTQAPLSRKSPGEPMIRKFIIPRECRLRFWNQLRIAGVDLPALFPDLESLAHDLRETGGAPW